MIPSPSSFGFTRSTIDHRHGSSAATSNHLHNILHTFSFHRSWIDFHPFHCSDWVVVFRCLKSIRSLIRLSCRSFVLSCLFGWSDWFLTTWATFALCSRYCGPSVRTSITEHITARICIVLTTAIIFCCLSIKICSRAIRTTENWFGWIFTRAIIFCRRCIKIRCCWIGATVHWVTSTSASGSMTVTECASTESHSLCIKEEPKRTTSLLANPLMVVGAPRLRTTDMT